MTVTLNGEEVELSEAISLTGFALARPGFAVAVNGSVVPRSEHPDLQLAEGDQVEIVTAVQGG